MFQSAFWNQTWQDEELLKSSKKFMSVHDISTRMALQGGLLFLDPCMHFTHMLRYKRTWESWSISSNLSFFFFPRAPLVFIHYPTHPLTPLFHHGLFSLPHSSVFCCFFKSWPHQLHCFKIPSTLSLEDTFHFCSHVRKQAILNIEIFRNSPTDVKVPSPTCVVHSHTQAQLISKVWARL